MDVRTIIPEIWLHVFSYLHKSDLKTLRLSGSHFLKPLASSCLFTTGYLAARKGVLETFVALATHPEYREYVNTVVYDSSYLDPKVMEHNPMNEFGKALATLFRQQEELQAGEIRTYMDKAFKCLPNITHVIYADLSRKAYLPGDRSDSEWRCDHKDGPVTQRIVSTVGDTYLDFSRPNMGRDYCEQHVGKADGFHRHSAGFIPLMTAIAQHNTETLRSFSIGDGIFAAGRGGIPQWFFSKPENLESSLLPNFKCLRKLELTLTRCWPEDITDEEYPREIDSKPSYAGLRRVLASSQNLQEMKLVSANYRLPFHQLLSDHRWEKLHTIHLGNWMGSVDSLKTFIQLHSHTLRHCTLDVFYTSKEDSWKDLVSVIPSIAPKLEFLYSLVFDVPHFNFDLWEDPRNPREDISPIRDTHFADDGLTINHQAGETTDHSEDNVQIDEEGSEYIPKDNSVISDDEVLEYIPQDPSIISDDEVLEYDSDESNSSTTSNSINASERTSNLLDADN